MTERIGPAGARMTFGPSIKGTDRVHCGWWSRLADEIESHLSLRSRHHARARGILGAQRHGELVRDGRHVRDMP